MPCVRISLCYLVVGLCILMLSNGQQQKPEPKMAKIKNSSIGTDQMTGHDGASSSNAQRKPLQVLMTSKSMSVRDSKEVIYTSYKFTHTIPGTYILVMSAGDESIFTIRPKIYGLGITAYEGHRGLEDSVVASSKHASFVVYHFKSNHLETHPISCKAIYDDKYYTLTPCIIDKSTDAKEEFKIMNAKGETIAELKERYNKRGIPEPWLDFEVEPDADVSFMAALVAVFGLINGII